MRIIIESHLKAPYCSPKYPLGVPGIMGNTIWFITILKEYPWLGFLIGLVFISFMFGAKNLIIYLYSKRQEEKNVSRKRHNPGNS